MRFDEAEYIRDAGVTPFGVDVLTYTRPLVLDDVYLRTMIMCGVIPWTIMMVLYSYMMMKLTREGNWRLVSVAALFLLYGLMENALVYPFFFFVPLVAFAPERKAA
jgi:hypothetical protein